MNPLMIFLVGLGLLIMALMDIKENKVYSFLPTSLILLLVIINLPNIYLGILGFIFGWLLYEFDFIRGIADLKIMVIISLTLSSLNSFFIFMGLVVGLGFIYQSIFISILKRENLEVPFVPLLFFVYVTLMMLEYLI